MCIPYKAVATAVNLTQGVMDVKNDYDTAKYKINNAINNAKNASINAREEYQKGIENSRKEKISGLYESSLLKAKNASGGFDSAADTNFYNAEDILNSANSNAENYESQARSKAQTYFLQANNYLQQANEVRNNYNNSLFKKALGGLGSFQKVEDKWFNKGGL